MALMSQTVARVNVDVPEESPRIGSVSGNRFSQAAMSRWHRSGA